MIGVQDSEFKRAEEAENLVLRTREGQKAQLEQTLRDKVFVSKWETSVSNPQRQWGLIKDYRVLEKELQKLSPYFRIIPVDKLPTRAVVCFKGEKLFFTERVMPEFSIMDTIEEEVPILENRIMSLDDPSTEIVKIPGRELFRGWRTVLIMLMYFGILTRTEVEKNFGSCDRPSWAHHTGKQKIQGVHF